MVEKIRNLIKKYRDEITYVFFGVATTAVNYVVYLPFYNLLHFSASTSNMIAWLAAASVAFLTNKPFVFHSHDWSIKTVFPEFTKFFSCRIASGVFETLFLWICVDLLNWNGNLWKFIASVLVIIFNYFASKFLVFRNK